MSGEREDVVCGPLQQRLLWGFVGLAPVGAVLVVVGVVIGGGSTAGLVIAGAVVGVVGIGCVHPATARVRADAYGVHSSTVLRRRHVPWGDIADLEVYVQRGRSQDMNRVRVVQNNGRRWRLPLPVGVRDMRYGVEFDTKLAAMRALHRAYGTPRTERAPVISPRAAGHAGAGKPLAVCVLLLIAAAVSASFTPVVNETHQAWRAALPCTSWTPAADRDECLSAEPAVIERTTVGRPKQRSFLYFADDRPLHRLSVSRDGARGFRPGDAVELTFWRHQVRVVTGADYIWRDHFVGTQSPAVLAALFVLGAGYPGAVAANRRRGRRLAADEVLPSVLPFVAVIGGTALWLLPLCYFHPLDMFGSPAPAAWAVAGLLATLVMAAAAWRASTPGEVTKATAGTRAGAAAETVDGSAASDDVFLPARFLEATDYNPHRFGTHIVLGGGRPPAVVPHAGPGRFAAKDIPVARLTVGDVRRLRGGDDETVPRAWHVATLDDAGTPVHLAAAPADLARILRELSAARQPDPQGS
ncbi:PH domain-containing protein [Actinacidiphila alni]|uniref:PH domain-containing protein n=1 Tax=Actinacidiphila alni TaxID=380248 RepID=UPI0034546326